MRFWPDAARRLGFYDQAWRLSGLQRRRPADLGHRARFANGCGGLAFAHGDQVIVIGVVLQQPVIKHAPGNRRCRRGSEARVFHNHGQRDFRVLSGRKCDIQGVVTLLLIHACRVVFFVLG